MTFTDLFVLLVVRKKVMTMTEFYEADAFDIDLAARHLDQADRDASERMRTMVWAALSPYSKKKIMPEDVIKFSWEKEAATKPTTREDFENAIKKFTKKQ